MHSIRGLLVLVAIVAGGLGCLAYVFRSGGRRGR
jgi:hypothetical protein